MKVTIAEARSCLGRLCTQVQDPREIVVLTRYQHPVAALVSIAELRRLLNLQETEELGPRHPLSGRRGGSQLPGFVPGVDGTPVTPAEAAQQMQEIQMTRKAEREVLAAGGLAPVEGGELQVRQRWLRPVGWLTRMWRGR